MKLRIIFLMICSTLTIRSEEINPTPQQPDKVEASLSQLEQKPERTVQEQDNDAKEILKTFAGMVGNFLCIVKDPHNSANVRVQLANMLTGMITIAMEMFKSGRFYEAALEKEYHLDPTFIALLKAEFVRAAHEMENHDLHTV